MPKRIILACDGTWQSSDAGQPGMPSNAARLSRMLACEAKPSKGKNIVQVVYYQSGIGTGAVGVFERLIQGATGAGLEENVIRAYHFIATNYVEGDEICLFGFSRGAYTVRCVAWFLTKLGVLQPEDLVYFRDLYRVFMKEKGKLVFDDDSPDPELRGWSSKETMDAVGSVKGVSLMSDGDVMGDFKPRTRRRTIPNPVGIKVIGVWDTVGALGLPDSFLSKVLELFGGAKKEQNQLFDTSLNDNIQNAFQAIALDEHRVAFTPTLWYLEPTDTTDLRQCWFPGFHTDVGGGQPIYPARAEALAINDCALAWMCDQIDGLLEFDPVASAEILRPVRDDAVWNAGITKDPCTLLYRMKIAGGSELRIPGSYHKDLLNEEPDPSFEKITRERIHPSIHLRIAANMGYYPASLDARNHDGRKCPKWEFKDSNGNGAVWSRPAVDAQSNCCQVLPAQRRIDISEYVVKERPGMNNFELSLLPKAARNTLDKRNANDLNKRAGGY